MPPEGDDGYAGWSMPRTGGEATRLPRAGSEMTPPLLPGKTDKARPPPTRRQRPLQSRPLHQRFPAERPGSAGPLHRRRKDAGAGRRPLSPRGEENVGRPDSNPRPQRKLTRGPSQRLWQRDDAGNGPRILAAARLADFRLLWAVRRLSRLGGFQPAPNPGSRRRGRAR